MSIIQDFKPIAMKTGLEIYPNLKWLMLFSPFMLSSIVVNAQQSTPISQDLKNEVKVNLLGLAIGLPELSYERILNENMGIGVAVAAGIQNNKGYQEEYKFMITPHYHYYFGKKYGNGFFLEANATVFSDDAAQADEGGIRKDKTYYGLGGGIGMKQIFGKGFVAELILAVGGKLNNNPINNKGIDLGLYRRLGLSIGKRF